MFLARLCGVSWLILHYIYLKNSESGQYCKALKVEGTDTGEAGETMGLGLHFYICLLQPHLWCFCVHFL